MPKTTRYIVFSLLVILLVTILTNIYINQTSNRFLYENLESLPNNEYGLVLGTNKFLLRGGVNKYFEGRTKTTALLYRTKKIKKIIVSGYAENRYYNEPAQIKKELLNFGVPDTVIFLDTVGDRTLLSIKHLIKISTKDTITIISQKFHNQRAVFLANKAGINAIGFNVPDVYSKRDLRTHFREFFAKTLAFWEVMLNLHE
jgi:SanA protein